MKTRKVFFSFVLIGVTFFIAYLINMVLMFSDQPQAFGQYTSLIVTAMAFVLAFAALVMAKRGPTK